jgi:hypothetical protein
MTSEHLVSPIPTERLNKAGILNHSSSFAISTPYGANKEAIRRPLFTASVSFKHVLKVE